jgi:hypothetical protein
MKKKLFSIDITCRRGKTFVSWWRWNNDTEHGCFEKEIQVKTEATYDRLFRILPENKVAFIHPEPDQLSVSISL